MKESEGSPKCFSFSFLNNKNPCVHLHGFHITGLTLSFDYIYLLGRIDDASENWLFFCFCFISKIKWQEGGPIWS